MKAAKPLILLGILFLLAIGATTLVWRSTQDALWVQDVTAAPLTDTPGAVAVFLTIRNRGEPDRLLTVRTLVAQRARLMSTTTDAGLAIPADSSPTLGPDGAYIRMESVGGTLKKGRLLPITLRFERAGDIRTQARLVAPRTPGDAARYGLAGIGETHAVAPDEPRPGVSLDVQPDGEGWRLRVETRNFRFNTDSKDGKHVPGTGHAHLYLNGLKLQRLYESELTVGALPAGKHRFRVTLNSANHSTYLVAGEPVMDTVEIVIP